MSHVVCSLGFGLGDFQQSHGFTLEGYLGPLASSGLVAPVKVWTFNTSSCG